MKLYQLTRSVDSVVKIGVTNPLWYNYTIDYEINVFSIGL